MIKKIMNKYVGESMRIAPTLGNGWEAIASRAEIENKKSERSLD